MVREFELPACVIVKHANPCGVAVAGSIEQAYDRALAADPVSAYGGVVVLNRPVSEALGEKLAEQFVEVLFAPGFDEAALALLTQKPATRILEDRERRAGQPGRARPQARARRRARAGARLRHRGPRGHGGRLRLAERDGLGRPALRLAGLQARQLERDRARARPADDRDRRRPDEPRRLGADRARQGPRARAPTAGAVVASDAFFPFADGPQLALAAGVTGVIQPGGSKRDGEVIEAVERAGATMIFTHRRHFRH